MKDNIPLEFANIGEYNRTVLQQLINNNALLKVLIDFEVEKKAQNMVSEKYSPNDYGSEFGKEKKKIIEALNEKVREYKLEALAYINLKKE